MLLGPGTAQILINVLFVVLIFFGARWQARDVHNNLKISLAFSLAMGVLFYAGAYLALAYALFRGQGAYGRSKAIAITTGLWAFMWVPIWGAIMFFSAPTPVVVTTNDSMLVAHVPQSELALGVKNTSLSACNRLVACDRSPAQANFKRIVEKRKSCEACLSRGSCPAYGPDGNINCAGGDARRCAKRCAPADLLERYAEKGRCPNAVAYATAKGDPSSIEKMCAEDKGACAYGCDGPGGGGGDACSTGWRSYEDEDLGTDLSKVEPGIGYPSRAECEKHHARCAERDCAREPVAPPTRGDGSNCFCADTFAPLDSAPCLRLEKLCDRTSPQYLAALAVTGSESMGQAIKATTSQSDTAARVRALDESLSDALLF